MATKIYCAAMDCEFNNDKGVCTAKKIALSANSVMTVWEGRQNFNTCKTFQKSQEAIEIETKIAEIWTRWNGNNGKEEK